MARVSRDKFEKVRPKRRLRSEADSKSRETNEEVTGVSRELRERHTPSSPTLLPKGEGSPLSFQERVRVRASRSISSEHCPARFFSSFIHRIPAENMRDNSASLV